MKNYLQHYTLGLKDIFGTALICLCVLSSNNTALCQEGAKRKYTLAEKNIQHARENLPRQIKTEDPELTRQVHNLYIDCLFDKLWEPALPGLPYKWFSITGADDDSYGKCQLLWDPMFVLNAWAPLDDNEVVHDVFKNYWNRIDNNPEAPPGSYKYGLIPCTTKPDQSEDGYSQIPIIAWGCMMIFNQTHDFELLELSIPYLDKYLTWYATERDVDNDGLIEYGAYKRVSIGDLVQTARFETFDFHATLDDLQLTEHPTRGTGGAWYGNIEGVEQTSFLAMSERAMIEMCQITGRFEMRGKYASRLAKRTEAIRTKMWDPETKFFYSLNRDTDKKIRIKTLQGFLTLTAGLASEAQAKELVKQLTDPSLFWSKYPVTTSSMDEPTFKPDGFWRGDMWPPTNYLVALGLNRYGYFDIAIQLADKTQELLKKYDGHAYERYNGVTGETLGVKDYCWGVAAWSIAVNTIYGIQEDYRTIVIPSHAKGRRLKLGKLEVNYLTDTSVELITSFEREFRVVFPAQSGKIAVNCNGKSVKNITANASASEVTFTAMPGKTYVVSKSRDFGQSGDSASSNFWDEIPVSPSTTVPGQITDDYWHGQFQRVNQEVARATDTELVFFGNSITWMWTLGSATGQDVWNKNYSAYHPINMGNSGDITPVMLYRVTSGNIDFAEGHQPKVAVLLCGTNNFVVNQSDGGDVKWDLGADCPPADVANGVRAIAQVFRRRLPQTRVILMGILPVSDKTKWARCQQVNAINSALNYDENEVVYLDLQDKFLQADGSINKELFTDGTHLTVEGYKVWAKSLDNLVTKMMKADPINPVKIMLIGGSITEGANSGESYRRYLDGMLRREGILIDFVGSRKSHNDNQTEPDSYQYDADHEGHWGKNSGWLAKNMPDLLNRDVPNVAVIHMGTEDIVSGSGTDGALTDTIIDNISSVIKSLRSKNKSVKIVLAKIIPIQGQTDMVNLLNLKISRYIKANSTAQSPVVMADQHTGFDPSADMADNGILPNARGGKKMARVFADVIKEGKFLDHEK